MSESSERIGQYWSRLTGGDRAAHLALSGSVAAVILIVALIAWSAGGGEGPSPLTPGAISERAADAADDGLPLEPSATQDGASGSRSSATASIPGSDSAGTSVEAGSPALPPISSTHMKVGITYLEDPGTANAAAGFAGIGQVDQRRAWEALIKRINADPPHGRKIVPVWYSQSTTEVQSKGAERIEQEACAHFTRDNKVFMVWDGALVGSSTTFNSCATKARIPQIGGGGGLSWSKTYQDFPYLVEPGSAALDRMAAFYVDQLVAQGFFAKFKRNEAPYTPCNEAVPCSGAPRIGLIRYDQPSYKAAATVLKQRLAANGLALCSGCEFEIAYSGTNPSEQLDDATEVNAAIQNCKGRPQGECTHMLFLGSTAGLRIPLFFIDGAERQRYRPRIGFSPLDVPTAVRDFLGSSSYEQFRDSMLVTWSPSQFDERTKAFERCRKIIEDAGETFQGSEASNKEAQIPGYCDTAWYFEEAIARAGPSLDVGTWMNGVHSAQPIESAGAYRIQTRKGRHDGNSAVRVGLWAADCNCFKPITPVTLV